MATSREHIRRVWFPRVTLRGGVFLAAGTALFLNALITNRRDLLFIAALLLALPLVALVYVAISPARVRVARVFRPPIVPAGGESVVALELRNLSTVALTGMSWRDSVPEDIDSPVGGLLPGLERYRDGPGTGPDCVRLQYTITPHLRGVYDIGPLMLVRNDPFGLAAGERTVGEPHVLIVTPRVTPLSDGGFGITGGEGSVRALLQQASSNSDELIAREYRSGDPFRRVNWPATARHGEIMVRQEEHQSNPSVRLILDTALSGRPARSPAQSGERERRHEQAFELAIELAASVGVHLLDSGFQLELVELGDEALPGLSEGSAAAHSFSSGGDQLLLERLAGIIPAEHPPARGATRPVPSGGAHGSGGPIPTIAVLVDIDDQDAAELAGLRDTCGPALTFILDTMSGSAVERLRDAGWHCVRLRRSRDIPAAWAGAQHEHGAVHGPA